VSTPLVEPRPLRCDAEANRRRILEAAAGAFAEGGFETGVEAIARRAGVGMGTLYRRFPTKEHLVRAILESRVAEICEVAAEAENDDDAWRALETVLTAALRLQARDRGVLHLAVQSLGPEAVPQNLGEFYARLGELLARAQVAGQARADVTPDDLPVLVRMAATATVPALSGADRSGEWPRYLGFVLDGLRAR
jgi:AcrR family transcriptional regulator